MDEYKIDLPIGTTFNYGDKSGIVVKSSKNLTCRDCIMIDEPSCIHIACCDDDRKDHTYVIIKSIENGNRSN